MAVTSEVRKEEYREVKSILVSQPPPQRSPYFDIQEKYGLQIDFRPFVQVEGLSEKEFRKFRIRPDEFTAIIFTSKSAIEHFFRLCEEMRIKVSADMKYFCKTETVANYLQKFILFRKRKVFAGNKSLEDIANYFVKHNKEKFLLPCSNLGSQDVVKFLESKNVNFQEAMMFRSVSADLSDLRDIFYDVLVFFSPVDIQSLFENFPDFRQNNTRIAVFGELTQAAAEEKGLFVNICAPTPEAPSMSMALELYLQKSNL
jgi:uroporphyrinogen-III synthase